MGEKHGQMTKNVLNSYKFSQTATERLDLFLCLGAQDWVKGLIWGQPLKNVC